MATPKPPNLTGAEFSLLKQLFAHRLIIRLPTFLKHLNLPILCQYVVTLSMFAYHN